MTDLIAREDNLPASLEDLSKFVLIGRDKLQAVRAEINAMKNLNLAKEVHEQKLREGQEIGKLVLLAEARLGELFKQMPKVGVGGNGSNQYKTAIIPDARNNSTDESEEEEPPPKPKLEVAAQMGFNKNQVAQFQTLVNNPEIVNQTIAKAKENGEIPTRAAALVRIPSSRSPVELASFFNLATTPSTRRPRILQTSERQ